VEIIFCSIRKVSVRRAGSGKVVSVPLKIDITISHSGIGRKLSASSEYHLLAPGRGSLPIFSEDCEISVGEEGTAEKRREILLLVCPFSGCEVSEFNGWKTSRRIHGCEIPASGNPNTF